MSAVAIGVPSWIRRATVDTVRAASATSRATSSTSSAEASGSVTVRSTSRPVRRVAPAVHTVERHAAPRRDPGDPGHLLEPFVHALAPSTEDQQVEDSTAEAHDGPVGVEHPLVLTDRRPHHLHEVARRQLLGAPGHQRADLRRLLAAELGILERA